MSRVAFVGLGRMGSGMAARLVQAGHEVCLYNRTASRAGPLIAIGARRFDSPREACDRADAVVAMVSDDAASEAVWLGPEGILAAHLESGASVIECSTLSYDWVMRLNLLGAVQIASAAETMALAEKAGLDLETVASALARGQAASPQVVRITRRIAADQHANPDFTPELRLKDVQYALQLTARLGVGSPFGAVAERMFRQLCESGLGQANESRIIEVARRQPADLG